MQKKQIARVPWFTWPSGTPQLIGSRCKSCGDYFFPTTPTCRNPNCRSEDVEEVRLSRRGKLWSYVVQHYPPPPPYRAAKPFVPFGIAQVRFPEGLRINGLVDSDANLDSLKIGMEMEVVVGKLYEDEQGNEIMIWKFKPVEN